VQLSGPLVILVTRSVVMRSVVMTFRHLQTLYFPRLVMCLPGKFVRVIRILPRSC
jgi:hypothetical protein